MSALYMRQANVLMAPRRRYCGGVNTRGIGVDGLSLDSQLALLGDLLCRRGSSVRQRHLVLVVQFGKSIHCVGETPPFRDCLVWTPPQRGLDSSWERF
jgi:hypothetical protein